jgi:hypothetical protein
LLQQLLGKLDEGDEDGGCEMTLKSVTTWMSQMTWIHGDGGDHHGGHGELTLIRLTSLTSWTSFHDDVRGACPS